MPSSALCPTLILLLQVEPVAVACLIRLFLRYIVEVEALPTKGFTKVQMGCYVKTLEVCCVGCWQLITLNPRVRLEGRVRVVRYCCVCVSRLVYPLQCNTHKYSGSTV